MATFQIAPSKMCIATLLVVAVDAATRLAAPDDATTSAAHAKLTRIQEETTNQVVAESSPEEFQTLVASTKQRLKEVVDPLEGEMKSEFGDEYDPSAPHMRDIVWDREVL